MLQAGCLETNAVLVAPRSPLVSTTDSSDRVEVYAANSDEADRQC